jgi:hypothetical protein
LITFIDLITELASQARPTEQQMLDLLEGWSTYFESLGVPEADQLEEFESVIQMRARAGVVSLVAPTLDEG